jgi:hypothetical protein
VGDLVLRLRQDARGRHKLTPPWEGPFIIAKILKPGTYKLANDQNVSSRLCTSVPLHIQIKSPAVKGGSALPQQRPTLPRGLEGGNPLCVKIFLEKVFYQNVFCVF